MTVEHVPVRTAISLSKHLKRVLEVYGHAGFSVKTILRVSNAEYRVTAAKETVSEVEQTIRMVKERICGLLATLHFSHIPKRMKIEFVYFAILRLNAFLVKLGISQTISPRELLMHWRLDHKKLCRVQQGTYCEVHNESVPKNTMVWCTHEAIALGPTDNLQGSVKFYCIDTGWVLK